MKYFLTFLLFCSSSLFSGINTLSLYDSLDPDGEGSQHFHAEIWRIGGGKYCVKILNYDFSNNERNLYLVFDRPILIGAGKVPNNQILIEKIQESNREF